MRGGGLLGECTIDCPCGVGLCGRQEMVLSYKVAGSMESKGVRE